MKTNLFAPVKPLRDGSRVALVAPSGILPDPEHVKRAEDNVRSMGWIPVTGANVSRTLGYLAGTDDERISDLNRALTDDSIDAIWCVRGGYGAMRLLPDVDYRALADNPRPFIGFSDITAFHAAVIRCISSREIHVREAQDG